MWVPVCLFLFWGHHEKVLKKLFRAIAAALCFLSCGVLTIIGLWPVFWEPAFGLLAASLLGVTVLLLNTLKKNNEQKWISLLLLLTTGIVLVVVSTNAIRVVWLILDRVTWAVTTPHEVEHFFLGESCIRSGMVVLLVCLVYKKYSADATAGICLCFLVLDKTKDLS